MGETVEQGRVDEGLLGEEDILQARGRGEEHGGGIEVGVAYGLQIVSLHYAVAVTHVYFHYKYCIVVVGYSVLRTIHR